MKKYIILLLAVLMTAFTSTAFAFTPPDKPADGWYVLDQAGKLTTDQKTQLNTKIDNINKTTKNEFGVLIVNSLDGDDIEDAAQATFRSWGIGKAGLNNGILLMISAGDRKMRLQTGKGVEGDLPDLRAKDLLDEQLKPSLKAGDWYEGIDKLITATSGYLESRAGQQAAAKSTSPVGANPVADSASRSSDVSSAAGIVLLFIAGFGGFLICLFLIIRHVNKRKEAELQAEREVMEANELRAARKRDEDRARRQAEESARQQRLELQTPHIAVAAGRSYAGVTSDNPVATGKHATAVAIGKGAAAAAVVGGTAIAISALAERERAAKRRREEEEESNRRRRQQEDDDRRRRESETSSYSSSWSSSDSSSSFGSDSGGGFGGGDSGGGGASSDF